MQKSKKSARRLLSVDYEDGHHAALGNTLKYSETKTCPKFTITPIDDSDTRQSPSAFSSPIKFTIVMTDPDAVLASASADQHPVSGQFAHLIISGLQLPSVDYIPTPTEVDSQAGQILLDYERPGPPTTVARASTTSSQRSADGNTSTTNSTIAAKRPIVKRRHRYVFLLFREDMRQTPLPPKTRMHWGMEVDEQEHVVAGAREWARLYGLTLIGM